MISMTTPSYAAPGSGGSCITKRRTHSSLAKRASTPRIQPPTPIGPPEAEQPQVMLIKVMKLFVPPEAPTANKEEDDAQG